MWRKNATAREMPSNLRLKKAWGQKKVTGLNPTAGKNLSCRNSVEGINHLQPSASENSYFNIDVLCSFLCFPLFRPVLVAAANLNWGKLRRKSCFPSIFPRPRPKEKPPLLVDAVSAEQLLGPGS